MNQNKKPVSSRPAQAKAPVKKKSPAANSFRQWYWLAGILVLTFIVFYPALGNALTNWDDPTYLNDNPLIRSLSWTNIHRIFTEPYFGNYQPLHVLSYAIEYHFYRLNPAGYHATSVVLHLLVTTFVCLFIYALARNSTVALLAALLFGIHPLHVESVAWAAERKDLLYALFFVASLTLYIKYIREGEKLKYLLYALLLFVLSILSKAMAASLPPVLILIDIFLKRKFSSKLIFEKIPFFAVAIGFGFLAAYISSSTGQVSLHVFSLFERILFACSNLILYTCKLIVPFGLSAYYPYPARAAGGLAWYYYVAPVIIVTLAFLLIRSLKKTKVFLFGAGFFVVCIFLVLQLFPVGPTIISERYVYVSSIGFFFLAAWLLNQVKEKRKKLVTPVVVVFSLYCIYLSAVTLQRCRIWKDSMTLWTNVLEQFPNTGMALNNRGNIYGKEMGNLDLALADFDRSIKYDPDFENSYANRGIVYCLRGKFDLALNDFNKALQIKPDYYEALINRGIAYMQTGQNDKAVADFTRVMALKKDDPSSFLNRGVAYSQLGKLDEALADLNTAVALKPDDAQAFYRRSNVLYNKKNYPEAFADLQKAVSLGMTVDDKYYETIKQAAEKH